MGRALADAEATRMLEDLADGQVRQQSHGEHDPQDDLMGQGASAGIDPSGVLECLSNGVGWDNLIQSRQSIEHPPRRIGRQRALSWLHPRHSLLGALLVGNPKVTGGCDLRLFQRPWG